jgi:hypothetical protein
MIRATIFLDHTVFKRTETFDPNILKTMSKSPTIECKKFMASSQSFRTCAVPANDLAPNRRITVQVKPFFNSLKTLEDHWEASYEFPLTGMAYSKGVTDVEIWLPTQWTAACLAHRDLHKIIMPFVAMWCTLPPDFPRFVQNGDFKLCTVEQHKTGELNDLTKLAIENSEKIMRYIQVRERERLASMWLKSPDLPTADEVDAFMETDPDPAAIDILFDYIKRGVSDIRGPIDPVIHWI